MLMKPWRGSAAATLERVVRGDVGEEAGELGMVVRRVACRADVDVSHF